MKKYRVTFELASVGVFVTAKNEREAKAKARGKLAKRPADKLTERKRTYANETYR